MSDVHSPEPDPRKVRFPVTCPACGKGTLGWNIIGSDYTMRGEARYCGTLLPPGIDFLDRVPSPVVDPLAPSPAPIMRFGRLDKSRVGTASARHVRSNNQVEVPMYPLATIREALSACRITTQFRNVIAFAPLLTWCEECHTAQIVNRPEGAHAIE